MSQTLSLSQLIGIGLRHPHMTHILEERPAIGWLEIHSENFFHKGPHFEHLLRIREHYPISLHGVGLSLGSIEGIREDHLIRLRNLIDHIDPCFVSEHLSWSHINGVYLPDLLPVPYNAESFDVFRQNIEKTQDFLQREIFIENPSSYLQYKMSDQEEVDFLVSLSEVTGAKILLDVNNIFVSCTNHGWDSKKYMDAIPTDLVKEIHLAGHALRELPSGEILRIDTHDNVVCDDVFTLYEYAIQKFGLVPTLLEWDAQIPELSFLIQEASKSLKYLSKYQDSHVKV